jgi:addiction module HigA family antidote
VSGHWSVRVSGNWRLTFTFDGEAAVLVDDQDYRGAVNAMSDMNNPPHPGETLREDVLPALGLTVTEAARQLGVTRSALSRVLNGRAAISPDMALRLEAWLGEQRGGRAEVWLAQQMAFDIWRARQKPRSEIARIPSA